MGMDKAQSTEPIPALSILAQIRQEDRMGIAHYGLANVAPPVDENTDLSCDIAGNFGEESCELRRDNCLRATTTIRETIEPL